MKSTVLSLPSFWVKVCSVILMLVCIGTASVQAQNYKPIEEAIADVMAAVAELEQSSQSHTQSTVSGTAAPKTSFKAGIRVAYFNEFIRIAKTMKGPNTAGALAQLDINLPVSSTPEPRKAELVKARVALIELITL